MSKKGQIGITGIIMGVISIIVFVALLPILNTVISDGLPYMDSWTTLVVTLLPLIFALMIVVGIVNYNRQVPM
jgi:predicted Kef-type K+ transport protein